MRAQTKSVQTSTVTHTDSSPPLADDQIEISTEEAHRTLLRLAREEGLLVGVSSGANLAAALRQLGWTPGAALVLLGIHPK